MKTTQAGLDLIEKAEDLRLTGYPDPESADGKPYTIGYGSTLGSIPPGETFTIGTVIDQPTAQRWLSYHIETNIEPAIDNMVNYVLSSNEYDALVSFCYNLGTGALQHSTMLERINGNDFNGAQVEFLKYDIAAGKQVDGLLSRRLKEAVMFGPLSRDQLISQYLAGFDPDA
jgi:lysozyme